MSSSVKRFMRQNKLLSTFYSGLLYPGLLRCLLRPMRIANFALNRISQALRATHLHAMPYMLTVEPVCGCNLKCPVCPVGSGKMKRKCGMMEFSTFRKVIDEMSPYSPFLYLTNWGEPMMHRDIFRFISYAKEKGMFVTLSSNAFYLSEESIGGLISSGLDAIKVSLDGATKESYLSYRKGSDFEKVIHNIRQLASEKKRLGSRKPYVNLQFIVMRHNEHEIGKIRKLSTELGVDRLSLKTVWVNDAREAERFVPRERGLSRYGKGMAPRTDDLCRAPWESAVINYDGTVGVCCMDYDVRLSMGNVKTQSFRSIWRSRRFSSFREQIKRDRSKIPICKGCVTPQPRFLE